MRYGFKQFVVVAVTSAIRFTPKYAARVPGVFRNHSLPSTANLISIHLLTWFAASLSVKSRVHSRLTFERSRTGENHSCIVMGLSFFLRLPSLRFFYLRMAH